jgi:hypothetical protein
MPSNQTLKFRDTVLSSEDIRWLQGEIDAGGYLVEIAKRACTKFKWIRPNGEPAISSCIVMLRRIEKQGVLHIPQAPSLKGGGSRSQYTNKWTFLRALGTVPGFVECQPTGQLHIRPIFPQERDGFRLYLEKHHYLGFERSVGESMGYVAQIGKELVALLDWGSAVLRCKPRDQYIGWDETTREKSLYRIVGNRRFLIMPWIRIPHLASRILGANLRRINRDWEEKYGHSLILAETFVDRRFQGTCYQASNWVYLGQSRGFTRVKRNKEVVRQLPKSVYVYPLAKNAAKKLRASNHQG